MARLNDWARQVWLHCAGAEQGLTVTEAERLFGPPPPQANTARRLLEHAASNGFFRSVREPHRDGAQGRWYRARYFAIGPEPAPLRSPKNAERAAERSMFGHLPAVGSVFALGYALNKNVSKTYKSGEAA